MRCKYIYNFHSVWAAKHFAARFKFTTSEGNNVYCDETNNEMDSFALTLKGSLHTLDGDTYIKIF